MTPRRLIRLRSPIRPATRIFALWLLCILAFPVAADSPTLEPTRDTGLTLEILMHHMSQTPGVRASFHESKQLSLLTQPITTSGTIYFIPPDRFARHTTEPGRTVLVIDGDSLRFDDEIGDQAIDLSADPIARQFVENFTVLFNGDLEGLRERYAVAFQAGGQIAEPERWLLVLTPRADTMRRFVREISLRGQSDSLQEIVLVETDGDRTTTRFDAIDNRHAFSDAELSAAFPAAFGSSDPDERTP